jgi:hypothetical protein
MSTTTDKLDGIVAEHVDAVNAFDVEAILATFADDALVNDTHREFWGKDAIGRWLTTEIVGDRVTLEVTEVINHYGQTIVRGRYDGEYDKTDLPDELILTNYFSVRDRKIVCVIILHNNPANIGTLATDVPEAIRESVALTGPRDRSMLPPVPETPRLPTRRDSPRHRPIRAWQIIPRPNTPTTEFRHRRFSERPVRRHGPTDRQLPGRRRRTEWDLGPRWAHQHTRHRPR